MSIVNEISLMDEISLTDEVSLTNGLSLLDELKESIIEDEVKELGLENMNENYRILNADSANFFLKRLEELKSEENEINEMCDTEIQKYSNRVNSFRDSKLKTNINTQSYFKNLLERYAEAELAESSKKSIKLPFGTLQFRKTPAKYTYEDKLILQALKDNELSQFIVTTEAPNKAELKKKATVKDGKLYIDDKEIEGVSVSEGSTNFDVKLNV